MRNTRSDFTLRYPDETTRRIRLPKKPLNQGADGIIYAASGGKLALKLYHEPTKDPERPTKMRHMMLTPAEHEGRVHLAWRKANLEDHKATYSGYATPLLPISDYPNLALSSPPKGPELRKQPQSRDYRVRAA